MKQKMLTLRYVCETNYCKTFTGSKKVASKDEADKKVVAMLIVNKQEGRDKYSGFKLYDKDNNLIPGF